MNGATPDWTLAHSFLEVMRGGSLSAAARRLDIAQATVRRHIESLETIIGTPLFLRTPSGLTPTEAAHAAMPHAEALEAGVAALARSARDAGGIAGTVRVTCSEIVGAEVLPAILRDLLDAHPTLEIELVPSNIVQDLIRRDADIAVRMTRPTQAAIVARKIGTVALGLYAHATYLAGKASIARPADIAQCRLIGEDRDTQLAGVLRRFGIDDPRFSFRSDSHVAQLAALRAGAGIGVCQRPIAARDPALIAILPNRQVELDLYLAMHEDLRAAPRVRTVFDALAVGLTAYLASGADADVLAQERR